MATLTALPTAVGVSRASSHATASCSPRLPLRLVSGRVAPRQTAVRAIPVTDASAMAAVVDHANVVGDVALIDAATAGALQVRDDVCYDSIVLYDNIATR